MADILSVDIEVLDAAVRTLNSAEQVLTEAMHALARERHIDLGTRELDAAADSFQTRWKFGIERIGESARATTEGIERCLEAFRALDAAFADALDKSRAPLDTNCFTHLSTQATR